MSHEVSRNAPCPCGSGKKYKNCCIGKYTAAPARKRSFLTSIILLILVFAAGAGIMKWVDLNQSKSVPPPIPLELGPNTPQPPGPVPEGKVWSVEHGHWHDDVSGDTNSASQIAKGVAPASVRRPGPQPDGPVPEGKVWNEEHGHWHNKPTTTPATIKTVTGNDSVTTVDSSIAVDEDVPVDFEEIIDEITDDNTETPESEVGE